jgi:hypothetical protein
MPDAALCSGKAPTKLTVASDLFLLSERFTYNSNGIEIKRKETCGKVNDMTDGQCQDINSIHLQEHTASQSRRQPPTTSPLWEHQISDCEESCVKEKENMDTNEIT